MRRFIFSIDDAINLIKFSIQKSNLLSGKIVCPDMKSSKMIDIIRYWTKTYGGTYEKIKRRVGDKDDEILIAENELKSTSIMKHKNNKYFIIDPYKNNKKIINKKLDSSNAKKLSEKEIARLIKLGI